jgi:tetratricopeptide (TPR) repeat protein
MLGTFYAQQHSWKAAEAAFAKAVGLNPDFAYAWFMSGVSACGRGRFADAEKALRKSTKLQLGDKDLSAVAWQMLAITSAERGSTNEIREALDNLDRLDTKKAGAVYSDIRRNYPKLDLPIDRERH